MMLFAGGFRLPAMPVGPRGSPTLRRAQSGTGVVPRHHDARFLSGVVMRPRPRSMDVIGATACQVDSFFHTLHPGRFRVNLCSSSSMFSRNLCASSPLRHASCNDFNRNNAIRFRDLGGDGAGLPHRLHRQHAAAGA